MKELGQVCTPGGAVLFPPRLRVGAGVGHWANKCILPCKQFGGCRSGFSGCQCSVTRGVSLHPTLDTRHEHARSVAKTHAYSCEMFESKLLPQSISGKFTVCLVSLQFLNRHPDPQQLHPKFSVSTPPRHRLRCASSVPPLPSS